MRSESLYRNVSKYPSTFRGRSSQLAFLLRIDTLGGEVVGHPIYLRFKRKVPLYQPVRGFEDAGCHPEWPKVAEAVINAHVSLDIIRNRKPISDVKS